MQKRRLYESFNTTRELGITGNGTTNAVYGTTFADAGVGIGMKRGFRKFDKKGH